MTLNTNGSFTYTPTTGYVGLDSFTYQATNSAGTSTAATVTIGVGATAPVATPDAYTATAGIPLTINAPGVLLNDTGIPAPSATKASDPAHGTLIFNTNGSFTYTAAASYVGSDSFSYVASNSGGNSAPVAVTINVIAAPLTSITLNGPNGSTNPSGKVGATVQLTATGTYQNNATQPLPGTQVTWSTSNAAIATVDANGVVTGLTPGTVTITAKVGNVTQTITITITPLTGIGIGVPPAPNGRTGGTTNPPAARPLLPRFRVHRRRRGREQRQQHCQADGSILPNTLTLPVPDRTWRHRAGAFCCHASGVVRDTCGAIGERDNSIREGLDADGHDAWCAPACSVGVHPT